MPARVLVIGFDAAESTLIERMLEEAELPAFADLSARSRSLPLTSVADILPGAIWPEITTGRSVGSLGRYRHSRQLHTGETRARPIGQDEVDGTAFWTIASDAGRRVAIVDLVHTAPVRGLNGIHLVEWGLHDRKFGTQSEPAALLEDVRRGHGDYPVASCEHHGRTREGYERILDGLLDGVERKTDLVLDLLAREEWDLFACAFSEAHCVGHQFWHFFDPRQPSHDPGAPERLRKAVPAVYRRLDAALGRLLEAAGGKTAVAVFTSHGMGPYLGGPQLLPDVLARLGFGSGTKAAARARGKLPGRARRVLKQAVPPGLRRRLQATAGSLPDPLASPSTRAVALHNGGSSGAIRLNLRGREPYGSVEPGAGRRRSSRRSAESCWNSSTRRVTSASSSVR